MKRIAFALGAVAILLLGASTPSSCLSSLWPLFIPPTTISIHAINDAYDPASVELITGGASGSGASLVSGAAIFTADAATSQPSSGTAVGSGEDVKLQTLPCASITQTFKLKATLKNGSASPPTATSPELHYDADFSCGDQVNFIIRPAALAGFVVGYEVVAGAAD